MKYKDTENMTQEEQFRSGFKAISEEFDKELEKFSQTKESDPTGKSANEPGAKLDEGKVRVGLMMSGFASALMEVAKVSTHGAEKYSDDGWKEVPNPIPRYMDAMGRHILDHCSGEEIDPKSGLLHWSHVAWNALAVLHFLTQEGVADETDIR